MTDANRREILAAALAFGATAASTSAAAHPVTTSEGDDQVAADLKRYVDFGPKPAGGAADTAVGAWLAESLAALGFTIARQSFDAPFFTPVTTSLAIDGEITPVLPLPIVVPTPATGIAAPLVAIDHAGRSEHALAGAIALLELPFGRWSSALAKPIRAPIDAAIAAGAAAVVVITTGPTGKVIALNSDGRAPLFPRPVALLAPDRSAALIDAASGGRRATLTVTGTSGRRRAFNFVGRLDRGHGRWLVVSTPRSGWFTCAGERGGGVAAWLALARWAAADLRGHDLAFVCNTGHEYENLGAEHALETAVPKPAETAMWLHLGANLAARDWHDLLGTLGPLPSVDPQRYLCVSPPLLDAASQAFAGQPGFEHPYPSTLVAAGELTNVIRAGYGKVAGIFGSHRFHHVAEDDGRCIVVPPVHDAIEGFKRLIVAGTRSG
ncbi:hypothetical protein ACFO8O_16095 [Hephaestia sp. GCM10023244]|uniref:hypothetical protein n=1 Tax=unclassified Hephaestia TaxID=2631281 RepID=UPI0020773B50|nr:hypothetical protein [Hephaestia sp. MAHUQ-44]MCM8732480.1 hypothetical protein [Hephaestia sp. MAHUQ-44]